MEAEFRDESGKITSILEVTTDDGLIFPEIVGYKGRMFHYRGWSRKRVVYTEVKATVIDNLIKESSSSGSGLQIVDLATRVRVPLVPPAQGTTMAYAELVAKYGTARKWSMAYLEGKMTVEEENCVMNRCSRITVAIHAAEHLARASERFLAKLSRLTASL